MSFMNNAIRQQGNRARALPNIGQNPTQPPQSVPGLTPPPNSVSGPPPPVNPLGTTGPMSGAGAAPAPTQPVGNPFNLHPPGQAADPTHYNYEPQNDGSWRVYPPGVPAPDGAFTTSMPRAASTADYVRMSSQLRQAMYGR
jgi:hypothetical protein